jgi:hypothetical protein
MKMVEQFIKARKCGVPLLGIETPDQAATIRQLVEAINGKDKTPVICWDIIRGLTAANEAGKLEVQRIAPDEATQAEMVNPTNMLAKAVDLKDKSVIFMYNAQRFYGNEAVVQGIWNLRDPFKASARMLVLLGPTLQLPVELERDVILLDEALPTDEELAAIIKGVHEYAGLKPAAGEEGAQLVRAARGLAPFPAEQAVAMSLEKSGANVGRLWELKRKMIEQTKGLAMYNGGESFKDIGGIERIKRFGSLLFNGSQPPAAVIFVDEIEKAMAGSGASGAGDTSGTSQDQLGVLLSAMQDNEWSGMIAVGPPGCAKSLYAKALGNEHKVPTIKLDLGGMKGSLVGQSEQQVRAAVKIIKAVAGPSAYWVATCNSLNSLPPELRRRFTDGIWFFDLPDDAERKAIWDTLLAKYQLKDAALPNDESWTGADIRNVCSIAARLRCSLKEASTYITPVAKSDPQSIERLRKLADGSFLSASYQGVWTRSGQVVAPEGRRVSV